MSFKFILEYFFNLNKIANIFSFFKLKKNNGVQSLYVNI